MQGWVPCPCLIESLRGVLLVVQVAGNVKLLAISECACRQARVAALTKAVTGSGRRAFQHAPFVIRHTPCGIEIALRPVQCAAQPAAHTLSSLL